VISEGGEVLAIYVKRLSDSRTPRDEVFGGGWGTGISWVQSKLADLLNPSADRQNTIDKLLHFVNVYSKTPEFAIARIQPVGDLILDPDVLKVVE
jgi:hypothetical protein